MMQTVAQPPKTQQHVWDFASLELDVQIALVVGGISVFILLVMLVRAIYFMPRWMRRKEDAPTMEPIQVEELLVGNAPMILDVRTREEFRTGHIRFSQNYPIEEFHLHIQEILKERRDRPIVLVSTDDKEAHRTAKFLMKRDIQWIYVLYGGMKNWKAAGLPLYKVE